MKKLAALLFLTLLVTSAYSTISVKPTIPLKATEILIPIGKTGYKISLMELSTINIGDLQTLKQRKMSSFEKMAFRSSQKKLRKGISSDETITNKNLEKFFQKRGGETGFHGGGFALGFFLNIIGILIAYLINDDYKRNRVKWAYIGTSVILGILTILVAAASQ